jgi:hypothetical protein
MMAKSSLTWIVDAVLLLLLLESAVLWLLRRRIAPTTAWWRMLPMLTAGACLVAALRVALTGASPVWLLTALGAAFLAHLVDIASRWAPR